MPNLLILKDIPDAIYEQLQASATAQGCSLSDATIAFLEQACNLSSPKISIGERLARAQKLRASVSAQNFKTRDIAFFKRQGRS